MAASFGKIPATAERRLISVFTRSREWVELICAQCFLGKSMSARTSSRAASIMAPSRSFFTRSASAKASHWASASALVSWTKIVLSIAATEVRFLAGAWASAWPRANGRDTVGGSRRTLGGLRP